MGSYGSIAVSGASGGNRIMGVEASVHNKLVEVGRFVQGERGRYAKEVLG